MRRSVSTSVSVLVLAGVALLAQTPPVHAPDGGTMQRIQSIDVPPLPNASFTATVNTEWTRYLADGAISLLRNSRTIARDAAGRVFQERRTFVSGDPRTSRLTEVDLYDPMSHMMAVCDAQGRACELQAYFQPAVPPIPPTGPNLVRESLGIQHLNGLELVGTRETQTIPAGPIGADRTLSVVKEFWYSPTLGVNISTRRNDPRSGMEVFEVTNVDTSEPDPSRFMLPRGAQIIDRRRR